MQPGLFAFATACAFVGAALYVNMVEQPARLALEPRATVREWRTSNRRGFVMLAALAVIAALCGYVEHFRTGDMRWLIGATAMLASGPYAFYVMTPVNILLDDAPRDTPASATRTLMREWGLLEWGQTAIGLAAAGLLGWPLVAPP